MTDTTGRLRLGFSDLIPRHTGVAWHYTGGATALAILGSGGSLRATEALGMNDTEEVKRGRDLIDDWLDGRSQRLTEALGKRPWSGANATRETFVLCASLQGDDAGQWRAYADNGNGYALGVDCSLSLAVRSSGDQDVVPGPSPFPGTADPQKLQAYISDVNRHEPQIFPWSTVLYREEEALGILDNFESAFEAKLSTIEAMEEQGADEKMTKNFRRIVMARNALLFLEHLSYLVKSSTFSAEQEVRTVVTLRDDWHAGFTAGQFGVVRYIDLISSRPAPNTGKGRVRSPKWRAPVPVIATRLGPALDPQFGAQPIQRLAKRSGLTIEVDGSASGLRVRRR